VALALPPVPGLSGATNLAIPQEWNAKWFRNFIANQLKNADTRNAIAGPGIKITGNITQPATISSTGATSIVSGGPGITITSTGPGGTGTVTVTNSGVTQIIAGTNVTISPVGGTGAVTINSSGGGGGSLTVTDGTNSVSSVTNLAVSGAVITTSGSAHAQINVNVTPDTHPVTPYANNDEFEYGTTLDTTGARFSGANAWSWQQQNTASAVVTSGSLIVTGQVTSSAVNNVITQALPSGACTFVVKAGGVIPFSGNAFVPIFLLESSTGKAFGIGIYNNAGVADIVSVAGTLTGGWTSNPIANASAPSCWNYAIVLPPPQWYWRVVIGSTTFALSYSSDGLLWHTYGTFTTATYFTTAPNEIGFSMQGDNASGSAQMSVDWFRRTA
jgi:hypothetical protein